MGFGPDSVVCQVSTASRTLTAPLCSKADKLRLQSLPQHHEGKGFASSFLCLHAARVHGGLSPRASFPTWHSLAGARAGQW